MKSLLLLMIFSVNAYSDDFTYENGWCVTYEANGNTNKSCTIDNNFTKLPGNDCVIGPTVHDYNRKLKNDTFTRKISCFSPELETVFKCSFDPNWKDSDGEPDETVTTCTTKINNFILTMTINRYPSGKYKYKDMWKKNIESKKAI